MTTHAIPPDELRTRCCDSLEHVWNGNDWSTASERYAEDVVVHTPVHDEPLHGLEEFRGFHEMLHAAFPDWHGTVDDAVVQGDRVAMRWTIRGTHLGPLMGVPPTRRSFTTHEAAFARFGPDGLMVELWFYPDQVALMRQLGLMPAGPPPKALILAMRLRQRLRRR